MWAIQYLINGIYEASIWAIIGVAFLLIWRTDRFVNFTIASSYAIGAYISFVFREHAGFPVILSIIMGALLTGALSGLVGCFVIGRIRKRGASQLVLLLASFGLYIIFANMLSLVFGDEAISFYHPQISTFSFLGAQITPTQLLVFLILIIFVLLIGIVLKWSHWGMAWRAVSNDIELAGASGIESEIVIIQSSVFAGLLIGVAGGLVSMDISITPQMGLNELMMGIVVVLISGGRNVLGIVCGALLLAAAQHIAIWQIGAAWQNAIAFIILVLFLFFKPEGFFGKKVKSATV